MGWMVVWIDSNIGFEPEFGVRDSVLYNTDNRKYYLEDGKPRAGVNLIYN
jgi:hypothetical protein